MNWAGLEADLDTAGYARLPGLRNACAYRGCSTCAPTGIAQRVRLPGVLNVCAYRGCSTRANAGRRCALARADCLPAAGSHSESPSATRN